MKWLSIKRLGIGVTVQIVWEEIKMFTSIFGLSTSDDQLAHF